MNLKGNIENGIESMIECKWLIIVSCCLFISLLSWEIVGDEEGWDKSYWVLLMGVGILIIIFLMSYFNLIKRIIEIIK